ncbi:MAG: lipoyl domain-containing protein [Desulfobacteraceae bacterium]|jgi:pyruvate/2-oxoglutarate dehydrogenase complex dihydrolipoamide acyltransferase (E2) component
MVTLVNVPRYIALMKNYSSKPMLTKWMGKDGEPVQEGQPLVVVETTKASLEIEAAAAGTLFILRNVGDTVMIGDTLGMIANTKQEIEAFNVQLINYLNGPIEQPTGTSG